MSAERSVGCFCQCSCLPSEKKSLGKTSVVEKPDRTFGRQKRRGSLFWLNLGGEQVIDVVDGSKKGLQRWLLSYFGANLTASWWLVKMREGGRRFALNDEKK